LTVIPSNTASKRAARGPRGVHSIFRKVDVSAQTYLECNALCARCMQPLRINSHKNNRLDASYVVWCNQKLVVNSAKLVSDDVARSLT
jgi:hypothetical protein